jgi:hypothetical protein
VTKDEAIEFILAELERAEKLHPVWPTDVIHMGAIVAEEAGELIRACNNYSDNPNKPIEYFVNMEEEAVQVGAMAVRFLINL